VAVAGAVGVTVEAAAAGLAGAIGSPWRMELLRTPAGLVVLNDSYNANPTSMAAAVDALASLPAGSGSGPGSGAGGRRIAVLGPMAELGVHAAEEHQRLGKLVAAAGVDLLVAVAAPALADAAREAGVEVVGVEGPEQAQAVLAPRLRTGDAVLVKASRVAGLERVAAALAAWEPPGEPAG
jgi:UDP-N-acetylmuramoyl-tripeptide--D-alanyl-D-alanine ligase